MRKRRKKKEELITLIFKFLLMKIEIFTDVPAQILKAESTYRSGSQSNYPESDVREIYDLFIQGFEKHLENIFISK